jgi:hypothetical protein
MAGLGWRATVNCHGSWLVLMPGQKLLLLPARLSIGVPRSMRHRGRVVWRCFFLPDLLDDCCFLMCPTIYSFQLNDLLDELASFYPDFCRFVWSIIGGLAELVGVTC